MKRYIALFLAALMLLTLCACKKSSSSVQEPVSQHTQEPAATATPSPTPYVEPETFSVMAGTIQTDEDGMVWTTLAPMEGTTYLYDLLPEDIGYVYSFLIAGDNIYASVKEYNRSMDPASLYVFHRETGESALLADNASPACAFCLVGNDVFLYRGTSGFWSLNASTGENQQVLSDDADLLAARDGWFYYAKSDGALYRNNSTMGAEERLLDSCPSYWLCPGTDAMFTLAYEENGTKPVLEYRDFSGTLRSSASLPEDPGSIGSDGAYVYVPQPGLGELLVYDLADGQQTDSIPLPADIAQCMILHADENFLYCQALVNGLFQILRINIETSEASVLAEDILP